MLKKFVAAFATLLLGTGAAVVAIASPASAHTPTYQVNCDNLWFQGESYETNQGDATPNHLVVTVDGTEVLNTSFGTTFPKQIFSYSGAQTHTWSIVLDAWGGTGPNTQYDLNLSGTTSVCGSNDDEDEEDENEGHDWQYAAPSCTALTVTYPSTIGAGQANDANVRIKYGANYGTELTLNFHNNAGTWSGTQAFTFATHPNWPANIGPYKVVWTQVAGTNYHWEGEVVCNQLPADASASVTIIDPTCSAAAQLVLNTPTFATWGAVSGAYSVTATAVTGHTFAGGALTQTFTGTLAPRLSSTNPACAPAPVCIPRSAVSYTYNPATNSGVITVNNVPNSTGQLCQGFWVTATSWRYTTSGIWPQVLDVVQKLPKITTPGTYPYVATVTCGQGDIYASYNGEITPTPTLAGPSGWETFLHNMGFTGPSPTYVQQTAGCNGAPVTVPTAKSITECGTYGSVTVPADTDKIDYTLTGNGQTGVNIVTAVAKSPYVLKNYPADGWTFNLGTFTDCATPVAPKLTKVEECGTYGAVTPAVTPGVDYAVAFDPQTGDYTVTATPKPGFYFADNQTKVEFKGNVGAFVKCIDGNPADPSFTNQQCVEGVVQGGSITVELIEGFTYTITGPNGFVWVSADVPTVTDLEPGSYEVTVEAAPGYILTGPDNWPYQVSIDEPVNCALIPIPVIVPQEITCDADGSFTLPVIEGVTWFVDSVETNGTVNVPAAKTYTLTATLSAGTYWDGTPPNPWELVFSDPTDCVVQDAAASIDTIDATCLAPGAVDLVNTSVTHASWTTPMPTTPGTHTMEAQADSGHAFPGGALTKSFSVVIQEQLSSDSPFCDLPTEGLATPSYASTQPTCSAPGTYTVGGAINAEFVEWRVQGSSTVLPHNTPITALAGSTVTLVATSTDPIEHGLVDLKSDPWVNPIVLTFAIVGVCDTQLKTLALTGLDSGLGLTLAGGLVFLGIGGILVYARRRQLSDN